MDSKQSKRELRRRLPLGYACAALVLVLFIIKQPRPAVSMIIVGLCFVLWPMIKYAIESLMIFHIGDALQIRFQRTIYVKSVTNWSGVIISILIIILVIIINFMV